MRRVPIALAALLTSMGARAQEPAPAPPPPETAPETPPPSAAPPSEPAAAAPAPGQPPPDYYVEPAPRSEQAAPRRRPPPPPGTYEPPPPGYGPMYEPPPPPVPHHVAPKSALWVGARLGWFFPFGNVYARGVAQGPYLIYTGVPWSDYASSGPMFELDAGGRLARNYNLFVLWERAELRGGDAEEDLYGQQKGGDSDFWGLGLRASSDPDSVGFLTEIAIGYRRARTRWEDGTELRFTDGILEGRIGLGADIRLSEVFSLSPLVTLGVGSFGTIERKFSDGTKAAETTSFDQADGHAWLTFQLGGHFDLAGSH